MWTLEHVAKIAGALSVCVLGMAYAHEFGYFAYVGTHFQPLLSTTDYINNSILWMIPTLALTYAMINWNFLRDGVEQPIEWRNWKWILFVGLLATAAMAGAVLVGTNAFNVFGIPLLIVFWASVWRWIAKKLPAATQNEFFRTILRLGPPVVATLFLIGLDRGSSDLVQPREAYIVELKDKRETVLRVILRTIDKGLLVHNRQNGRVEFYRWDNVGVIAKAVESPRYSIACLWFDNYCPPRPPEP